MEQYSSNAKKLKETQEAKEQRPKLEPVVEEPAKEAKKSLGKKIKGLFVQADFRGTVLYVVTDVLVPAARNMIVEGAQRGVERVIYGENYAQRHGRGSSFSYGQKISYNRPGYASGIPPRQAPPINVGSRTAREGHHDVILSTRAEAERVLEMMNTVIDQFEFASVGDLRDLCGLQSSHTDQKWGWAVLGGVNIRPVREGWLLELPEPEPLIG